MDYIKPIYLDNHATTPVDPRVLESMLPFFSQVFGNPASKNHSYGNDAFKAVEESRENLASSIKARPQEVIFTSGATESINLAIKGIALREADTDRHFITASTEHKAVLDCFEWLTAKGFQTTILPVNAYGLLDPGQIADAIKPNTVLVSVMSANNEIGVLQPIEAIGAICRARGVLFLTDAAQALGKISIDVRRLNIDLLAASGHKIYGPKGIGLLYVRRSNPRVVLEPLIHGGGHEKGLRSGTLSTPNIVGFAKAVDLSLKEMSKEQERLHRLRTELLTTLKSQIPNLKINGTMEHRLAGNLNVTFPGVDSEALMIALKDEMAISSGSACTTAAVLPSHVLKAIGLTETEAHSSIRLGLGRFTSSADIQLCGSTLCREAARLQHFGSH